MKRMKWRWMALVAVLLLGLQARAVDYDLNGDGVVDQNDYELLAARIIDKSAAYDAKYDLDGNQLIDAVDANLLLNMMKHTLVYDVNGVKFEMVEVEGGTFMMGATEEQGEDVTRFELPVHQVTVSSYKIGQTLVTQALWEAVLGQEANESYVKGDELPIVMVTWDDCQTFIKKLNKMTGATFRMPTEAEWEFAARGGNKSKGYRYAGSNNVDEVAWHANNSDIMLHPVATKNPNELGLYDMSGNAWEWCNDWFDGYKTVDQIDPQGPSESPYSTKALRGGSVGDDETICRISNRKSYYPASRNSTIGFRLAQ